MATGVETTGRTQRRVSCCLCLRPLLDASAVKKRKLLHNDSCKKSKEVLNEVFLSKLALSLASFNETSDPLAYLCHLCDAQAAKIAKHRAELQLAEEQVLQKVSHLTRLDRSGETLGDRPRGKQSTNSRRKRARSEFHQAEDEILVTERMNHDEGVNVGVASPLTSTELESSLSTGNSPSVTVSNISSCKNYFQISLL